MKKYCIKWHLYKIFKFLRSFFFIDDDEIVMLYVKVSTDFFYNSYAIYTVINKSSRSLTVYDKI